MFITVIGRKVSATGATLSQRVDEQMQILTGSGFPNTLWFMVFLSLL